MDPASPIASSVNSEQMKRPEGNVIMQKGNKLVSLMKTMGRGFDGLVNLSALMAAVILIFIMLSVCAEIIMRYFFNSPLIWVIEISEYGILYITFLGTAWVLRREAHISMDLFIKLFGRSGRNSLRIFSAVAGAFVCYIFVRYGISVVWEYYLSGSARPTSLEVPTFLVLWIIPYGAMLLLLQFLRNLFNHTRSLRLSSEEREAEVQRI